MVSAGFVHLLGTAIKELDPMNRFPLAPFLCGLGFLVTLVADHIAETLSHRNGWHGTGGSGSHCVPPSMDTDVTLLQHVLVVDHRTQGVPLIAASLHHMHCVISWPLALLSADRYLRLLTSMLPVPDANCKTFGMV